MSIIFYSKSTDFAWLSNFSKHKFELDGVVWPSVEHYYQAQKYAGTPAERQIREAADAPKACKMGQDRTLVIRDDWDSVKEEIMRRAVKAKFSQNRRLREQLLATGDEELVHRSASDSYWGCGADGQGHNRLGVIIMGVRADLQRQT